MNNNKLISGYLECNFFKIKSVTHVVISADSFWIVVDHNSLPAEITELS